jgi:hypothetical protein
MGMALVFIGGDFSEEKNECPVKLCPVTMEVCVSSCTWWVRERLPHDPHPANTAFSLFSQRLVESRRQQIIKEFEELHRRLDEEQQVLLSRLEEEEQDILQRLRENAAHLGDKRRDLAHLAAEVEGKCLQSGFEMLKVRSLSLHSSTGQSISLGCSLSCSTSLSLALSSRHTQRVFF